MGAISSRVTTSAGRFGRAQTLERLGLAEQPAPAVWELKPNAEDSFTIRKPAVAVFTRIDYVTSGNLSAQAAEQLHEGVGELLGQDVTPTDATLPLPP